jgi:hypothetical protein
MRTWMLASFAIFVSGLGVIGVASGQNSAGDALSEGLHGGPLPQVVGAPDWSKPIFTKAGTPVCDDAGSLLGLAHWITQYGNADPSTLRNVFHCAVADDGLSVEALEPISAEEALGELSFHYLAIRWTRSDGTFDQGYAPIDSLRNEREVLSGGEVDALRAKLAKCWSPPLGWTDPAQVKVILLLSLNPDGSVAGVPKVLEAPEGRFVTAAPASAIRAAARCAPYDLPVDRYAAWKQVRVTFDPRDAPKP